MLSFFRLPIVFPYLLYFLLKFKILFVEKFACNFELKPDHNAISYKGPDGSIVYSTYVGFLQHFALPNAHLFNTIVPLGEFLVGLGLILGCLTTAATFFALVMNFFYIMAGTVSTNPLCILLGVIILVAGLNAGRIGLDR
ncbi:DoxX family membrane protein [Bacillus sp. EB600]|nr:DoxX family membrane protein [Bacillus sp. EB600]